MKDDNIRNFFAFLVSNKVFFNYEFAGFFSKTKVQGLDRLHGNGPYCKIPTEKEPIRALGFAQYNNLPLFTGVEVNSHIVIILNLFFVNNYAIQPTGCYVFIVSKQSKLSNNNLTVLG